MKVQITLIKAALLAALMLPAAVLAAETPKLIGLKQMGIEGGIHRARLVSLESACATQAEKGTFAFIGITPETVKYLHNELGESRLFIPTILGGLRGSALVLDEYGDRVYAFGQDGNATASCSLTKEVLATQYGSPTDILAAGGNFGDGFWLLTERGYILRVSDSGKLVSSFELRRIFNMPTAFFARLGKHGQNLFAFSPNSSQLLEFTSAGRPVKAYELLPALGGDLSVTDAVLTDSGGILVTRGNRLLSVVNGHSTEISLRGITDDAPLFLDALGSRVLIYNHTGEMLVGDLK